MTSVRLGFKWFIPQTYIEVQSALIVNGINAQIEAVEPSIQHEFLHMTNHEGSDPLATEFLCNEQVDD